MSRIFYKAASKYSTVVSYRFIVVFGEADHYPGYAREVGLFRGSLDDRTQQKSSKVLGCVMQRIFKRNVFFDVLSDVHENAVDRPCKHLQPQPDIKNRIATF